MAIYHQDIADIELNSGSLHRSFLGHSIGLGDAAANRFGVRVFRGGVAETLSGVTCQGFFRNANGENIALTSYGTIDGNVAYVTLPQACYNVEGMFTLAIKLVGGGVTGTMRIVDGVVDNTNTSSPVAPTGSVPTYQEVLSVYEQMQAAVTNYDIKVAEQDAEISDLRSAFDSVTGSTRNIFAGDNITGFIDTTTNKIASNANGAVVYAPCEEGEQYTVSKTAGHRFIVGTTAELPAIGSTVTDIVSNGTASNLTLTASSGAKYVVAFVYLSTADPTITREQMVASVQIEKGNTATEYVQHLTAVDSPARDAISKNADDISDINTDLAGFHGDFNDLEYNIGEVKSDLLNLTDSVIPGMQNAIQACSTKAYIDSAIATEQAARIESVYDLENAILAEETRAKAEEQRIEALFTDDVTDAVNEWIADNPDKMINLQDHSVGANKLAYSALNYVTPEMFGAAGDGITDDSAAIEAASAYAPVYCGDHTYLIDDDVTLVHGLIGGTFNMTLDKRFSVANSDSIEFKGCVFYSTELPGSDSRGQFQLYLSNCNGARITHCYFKRGVSGLYIDRSKNVMVDHNLFTNYPQLGLEAGGNGYGVLLVQCEYVDIDSNHFRDVARHAIYISHDIDGSSTYNKHIRVRNNSFIWTANVYGATSGFEVPINVRPAINVIIENNYFENVMSIATFNRQTIKVNGVDAFVGSEDIYIRGNIGYFKNTIRKDGVIFISSSSDTTEYPSTKNIHIENNIIKAEYGHFVCADNFDGLYIVRNMVTCLEGLAGIVTCKFKRKDLQQNLYIRDNTFHMLNGYIFSTRTYGESPSRFAYGDFEFVRNNVSGLRSIGFFTDIPEGVQNSFNRFIVAYNQIEFSHSRDYWSSPAIAEAYLRDNILNEEHALYIGTPTKLYNVDPAFTSYSGAINNPSEAIAGNVNVLSDNDIYIKTHTDWVKIN